MPETHLVVLCTVPDAATGERIAHALVGERLAACANLVPGLVSIYRWQGKVERAAEQLLVIKTVGARFAALEDRIRALHPYSVPEIVALPVTAGSRAYLDWLTDNTGPA